MLLLILLRIPLTPLLPQALLSLLLPLPLLLREAASIAMATSLFVSQWLALIPNPPWGVRPALDHGDSAGGHSERQFSHSAASAQLHHHHATVIAIEHAYYT